MIHGSLQHPQLRQVRAVAPEQPEQAAVPDVNAAEQELEGWRRNDVRFFAHQVELLERRLRRRTWILGVALLASLSAAAVMAMPQLRPLLPELELALTSGAARTSSHLAPVPEATAPVDTSQEAGGIRRLAAPDL